MIVGNPDQTQSETIRMTSAYVGSHETETAPRRIGYLLGLDRFYEDGTLTHTLLRPKERSSRVENHNWWLDGFFSRHDDRISFTCFFVVSVIIALQRRCWRAGIIFPLLSRICRVRQKRLSISTLPEKTFSPRKKHSATVTKLALKWWCRYSQLLSSSDSIIEKFHLTHVISRRLESCLCTRISIVSTRLVHNTPSTLENLRKAIYQNMVAKWDVLQFHDKCHSWVGTKWLSQFTCKTRVFEQMFWFLRSSFVDGGEKFWNWLLGSSAPKGRAASCVRIKLAKCGLDCQQLPKVPQNGQHDVIDWVWLSGNESKFYLHARWVLPAIQINA